ncbi:ribosomal protein S20 [Saprospira grandis DSM 2844]|uniref:Small ribosomal subunit protein bS20 n=1 Tax=Saprospira grandis DSM 2844 TaxID=694433 RepID=J1I4J1_9BACT|nr:30S ribosomal protein S20 [Saprospira grandis]EJF53630.1 ribosomal protein S20 [Saprospira grandis DSM 2844]
MANHKSAKKRIRQTTKRRVHNRFYKKTTRSAIKRLRSITEKSDAEKFLPKVVSMIDRLAKKNQVHKNKAANLKSKLTAYVNNL